METDRERTTSLQKMLGIHKCSLLYANGTKLANHKYCTKEDTREMVGETSIERTCLGCGYRDWETDRKSVV